MVLWVEKKQIINNRWKKRNNTKALFSLFSSLHVAAVCGLPSGMGALGDSHVCWGTAGFTVIMVWSSQANLGLQATTSTLITFPVCSGGTCHPAMTVCSALLLYPRAIISAFSLLSVVPELWLPTACQQHTLCPCHLSPITPAAATCSSTLPTSPLLPSVLVMLLQGKRFFFFFLIGGCCWTVTQLNSDIWEISCHLSLSWCTHSLCYLDI